MLRTVTFTLLVNPLAGGGATGAAAAAQRLLEAAGAAVRTELVEDEAMTLLAVDAACSRSDVVVAVGGDGTVASVAGRVAGNDFARMLGVPSDSVAAAAVLLARHTSTVDLIGCAVPGSGPRVVVGSVYAGVDAQAVELVEQLPWLPAVLQYPVAAVRALAAYRPVRMELAVDGVHHAFGAATVVIANSRYYGSGMRIAPDASVTDGLLDVVVVAAASRRSLITAMPTIYSGRHVLRSDVTVLRGTVVELRGAPVVPMGADGEPLGALPSLDGAPARFHVMPRALKVLTPA